MKAVRGFKRKHHEEADDQHGDDNAGRPHEVNEHLCSQSN